MQSYKEFMIEQPNGMFIAMSLSEDSRNDVGMYQRRIGLRKPLTGSKLHVTLVFTKKPMHGLETKGLLEIPLLADVASLAVYNGALVMELQSPTIEDRQTELLNRYNGDNKFDTYRPHVTISYDFDGDPSTLPVFDKTLVFVNEYQRPLSK